MPELPEVEVLARHLRPLLVGKRVRAVKVHRTRVLGSTSPAQLRRALRGATFTGVQRRGKYLIFEVKQPDARSTLPLVGHLGMTGRMYLVPVKSALPKHAAVVIDLGRELFVYEDTRYFGRFTLDTSSVSQLGPEPLSDEFNPKAFATALRRFKQTIKVKLLDQSLVAGIGNIYASEALFLAGIPPQISANRLSQAQVKHLHRAIRKTLSQAIRFGSTIPLNHTAKDGDGLFYFGRAEGALDYYEERLQVYDRQGKPCPECESSIRRIVQAARSTFFCPRCQPRSR